MKFFKFNFTFGDKGGNGHKPPEPHTFNTMREEAGLWTRLSYARKLALDRKDDPNMKIIARHVRVLMTRLAKCELSDDEEKKAILEELKKIEQQLGPWGRYKAGGN